MRAGYPEKGSWESPHEGWLPWKGQLGKAPRRAVTLKRAVGRALMRAGYPEKGSWEKPQGGLVPWKGQLGEPSWGLVTLKRAVGRALMRAGYPEKGSLESPEKGWWAPKWMQQPHPVWGGATTLIGWSATSWWVVGLRHPMPNKGTWRPLPVKGWGLSHPSWVISHTLMGVWMPSECSNRALPGCHTLFPILL